MSKLTILQYPDERLKRVARPVAVFDERLRALVADMAETMHAAPGVGLAATQVDVHERVIVIDVSENKDSLRVFVNPRIVQASEDTAVCEEGCLSVPGIYEQ
ncbi:MAG TPA: peptide deformylase, partial [Burkholderiaceae bacterium]